MEMVKRFEPLSLLLVIVVAVNYAIVTLFDGTNVISDVLGSGTVADVVYVLAGVGALTFVPKLVDELHLGGHGHPRGA